MRELPQGTVTLLFTDIAGSTRLLGELRDGYAGALAEHCRLLREVFERHRGVEVDTQGDSFFVAFAGASAALAAATDVQAALLGGPLRVRIGIHTGEPEVADGSYVGLDVHRAARIAAAGSGGRPSSRKRRASSSGPPASATSASTRSRTSAESASSRWERRTFPRSGR
jgi:class 3 adenylate cyclase